MGRILIPCPFDDDVLAVTKVHCEGAFKGKKKVRGPKGIRAQIASCKSLSSLVGDPIILDDCLRLLQVDPYGKNDAVGIDFKDKVLEYGTPDDAVGRLCLQVSKPLGPEGAEIIVQTLTPPDEKACFIAGWLYWRDVIRLGKDCGDYYQVRLFDTYEPAELIVVLKRRYRRV